jgi:phospholipid/cholesterol/gamma-HCH transport system substrate-binding protein
MLETVAGGVVLLVGAGFLFYAAQFAGADLLGDDEYLLTASFRSAEGVTVGSDVRLAGVRIGTVTGMELNPQTFRAETTFAIDSEVPLPDDTAVVVASEGLLGGTYIEMLPGGSPFNLEPGAEIEDTQSAVSLITLLLRYVTGSEE